MRRGLLETKVLIARQQREESPMEEITVVIEEEGEIEDAAEDKSKKGKFVAILCAILIVSLIFGWTPLNRTSVNMFDEAISKKMTEVTMVMGTTVAIGVVLDAIPFETGDQVTQKIFDVSGYLMVVVGALMVEKLLLRFSIIFCFGIVIPIACGFGIAYLCSRREAFKNIGMKLGIFGLVLAFAVPASVGVSMVVDNGFEAERALLMEQVDTEVSEAEEAAEEIVAEESNATATEGDTESGGFLEDLGAFFTGAGEAAGEFVSGIGETVSGAASSVLDNARRSLESLLLIAVQWVVSCCVVPIITLIGFGFVIKILFGYNVNAKVGSTVKRAHRKTSSTMAKGSKSLSS